MNPNVWALLQNLRSVLHVLEGMPMCGAAERELVGQCFGHIDALEKELCKPWPETPRNSRMK